MSGSELAELQEAIREARAHVYRQRYYGKHEQDRIDAEEWWAKYSGILEKKPPTTNTEPVGGGDVGRVVGTTHVPPAGNETQLGIVEDALQKSSNNLRAHHNNNDDDEAREREQQLSFFCSS
jgi:hypothetical protein